MIRTHLIHRQTASAVCLLVFLCLVPCFAQPDTLWTKGHSHHASNECTIIRTSDGGYALGGYGNRFEEDDAGDLMLVKFDSLVNVEWQQFYTFRRPQIDFGFSVTQLHNGGYAVGGSALTSMIVKTNADGDSLWMVIYDVEELESPTTGETECITAPDGNIIIVTEEVVAKVSEEEGDIIWRTELEATVSSVLAVGEEGFLVAGYTGRWEDVYIAFIDPNGEPVWEHVYGTEDSDLSVNAIAASGGGYCIAGLSRDGDGIHPLILRVDEEGELIWIQNYSDLRGCNLRDIAETPDGGFAACGFHRSYFLMRVDYAGELHWSVEYGWEGLWRWSAEAYNIFLMEDNSFLLAGFGDNGLEGAAFVRTEPDPIDLPFELEALTDLYEFEDVVVDSIASWDLRLHNPGRRFVVIDSVTLDGEAFSCEFQTRRIEPEDTTAYLVTFRPRNEETYTDTLRFWFGEQSVEVALSGRGIPLNAVEEDMWTLLDFELTTAYPNPFNSSIRVQFTVPEAGMVKMAVFDIAGREVASGVHWYAAGNHIAAWRAEEQAAGTYLLQLTSYSQTQTQKITLVK